MKIVIVGLGSIGRRHLKNLISLGERDIILCRNMLSSLPDDDLKGYPVETSIEAALKHKPDAVIISNPTALHLNAAVPAAKAGCHILLEKPVSHSFEHIDELKDALKIGGGQLLVGFQFRFHPTLKIAAKMVADEKLGNIISFRSQWGEYLPDWHKWEDYKKSYSAREDLGGGVALTLCHPIDYLNWIMGKPELVWARSSTLGDLDIPVDDVADFVLLLPGGASGYIHLDYVQRPAKHNLEIVGTKGTLRWDNSDGVLIFTPHGADNVETFSPPKDFDRNSMFMDEMRHFLAIARGEAVPICTLEDGLLALEIALAANSSKNEVKYV